MQYIPGLVPGFHSLTLSANCINCAAIKSSSNINDPACIFLEEFDFSSLSDDDDEWTDPFFKLGVRDFPQQGHMIHLVCKDYTLLYWHILVCSIII